MKNLINFKHWKAILFSVVFFSSFIVSKQYTDPFFVPKNFYLFFTSGIFLLIICISLFNKKETVKFNILDIAILLFLIWIFVSLLFSSGTSVDNVDFYIYLCCATLYFSMKIFTERTKDEISPKDTIINILLIIGIIQVFWGFFQYYDIFPNFQQQFKIGGAFGNPSQYTNFIVPIFAFALSSCLFSSNNKILALISSISLIIILPFTHERTAWIASVLVIIYLTEIKYRFIKRTWNSLNSVVLKMLIIVILVGMIFPIGTILYQVKKDSSSGRLFIWQISLTMIKDKPITGFGFDRYAAVHNDYQVKYFQSHPNEKEKIYIADCVNYAFNEFIQIAAETGILGAIILLIIFIVPFISKQNEEAIINNKHIYGARAAIIAVFVSALFSYPIHTAPSILIFFFSLGIISLESDYKGFEFQFIKRSRKILLFFFVVLITVFLLIQYERNNAERKWLTAYQLMRENRVNEAYAIYTELYPKLDYSQFFLFNYGAELSLINQYDESIKILKEAEPRLNDSDFYIYLGNSYENKGQLKMAEESYEKAMFVMPVKLLPRYKLVYIYLKTNRIDKAITMANFVLNMKVKVKSPTTEVIRQDLLNLINK